MIMAMHTVPNAASYGILTDNSGSTAFLSPLPASARTGEQPDLLILKLIEKLRDADPLVRRNAAGALRLQGARAVAAISAIATLLTDQDVRVRNEAERAIDHLKLVA